MMVLRDLLHTDTDTFFYTVKPSNRLYFNSTLHYLLPICMATCIISAHYFRLRNINSDLVFLLL